MSSKKPIVRQVAWAAMLPQLIFLGSLMLVFSLIVKPLSTATLYATVVYLVISLTLRNTITHNQRKGMTLTKAEKYPQAIDEFKKSYAFFRKYAWIDKYRYMTLLSSSRISYTEMALVNIAFCYTQSGNAELSKEYYQKALQLFPDSGMAQSALNMIKAFEDKADRQKAVDDE